MSDTVKLETAMTTGLNGSGKLMSSKVPRCPPEFVSGVAHSDSKDTNKTLMEEAVCTSVATV